QMRDRAREHRVFDDIGETAGMECVAVIHRGRRPKDTQRLQRNGSAQDSTGIFMKRNATYQSIRLLASVNPSSLRDPFCETKMSWRQAPGSSERRPSRESRYAQTQRGRMFPAESLNRPRAPA